MYNLNIYAINITSITEVAMAEAIGTGIEADPICRLRKMWK